MFKYFVMASRSFTLVAGLVLACNLFLSSHVIAFTPLPLPTVPPASPPAAPVCPVDVQQFGVCFSKFGRSRGRRSVCCQLLAELAEHDAFECLGTFLEMQGFARFFSKKFTKSILRRCGIRVPF